MRGIKSEEIFPENFDEFKESGSTLHTVIMLQAITAILISKNIMTPEEINETAKELYKIQREMFIKELEK